MQCPLLAHPARSAYGSFLERSALTGSNLGTRASGRGQDAERTAIVSNGREAGFGRTAGLRMDCARSCLSLYTHNPPGAGLDQSFHALQLGSKLASMTSLVSTRVGT
jgi:hypothetical protein